MGQNEDSCSIQQLMHQDLPGISKTYPEKILYIIIFYIIFIFHNIVTLLVSLVSHCACASNFKHSIGWRCIGMFLSADRRFNGRQ